MDESLSLPQDVKACHAFIAELSSRLHSQKTLVIEQSQTVAELQGAREQLSQENTELKLTVERLLASLYGRRSERLFEDPNQLKLDFQHDPAAAEALADAAEEAERIVEEYTVRRTLKKKQPRNERLPEHLPRYEVTVDADEEDKHCAAHGPKQLIGYDETETLVFERPKLKVRVTKFAKYACPSEPECGVSAPSGRRPSSKGTATTPASRRRSSRLSMAIICRSIVSRTGSPAVAGPPAARRF